VASEPGHGLPLVITGGDPSRPGEELIFTAREVTGSGSGHSATFQRWTSMLVQSAEWTMRGPISQRVLPFPDLAHWWRFSRTPCGGRSGSD
jgi:hypothetical protein